MNKIRWSARSRDDLKAICDYISKDSQRIARSYTSRLVNSVERLDRFPEAGEVLVKFGEFDYRQISFGSYQIVYRHTGKIIDIVTIVHAARLLDPTDMS